MQMPRRSALRTRGIGRNRSQPRLNKERPTRRNRTASRGRDDDGEGVVLHIMASVGDQPYRTRQSHGPAAATADFSGAHLGEVTLQLSPSEERPVTSKEIATLWRDRTGPVPDAVELIFTSSLFDSGEPVNVELTGPDLDDLQADATVCKVWRAQRITCLKRGTLGQYLLRVLDEPWRSYTQFHLDVVGCPMCLANLEDLQSEEEAAEQPGGARQIFASSVGFLSRVSNPDLPDTPDP